VGYGVKSFCHHIKFSCYIAGMQLYRNWCIYLKMRGRSRGLGRVMGCRNTPSAANNTPSPHQPMSNFVKHPLQNTENDRHQWLFDSFKMYHIRFRPGLRSDPAGGAYCGSPDLLASLRGPTSKVRRRLGKKGKGEGRERKGRGQKANAYNTCIAPQATFHSCSGAVHVTDRA